MALLVSLWGVADLVFDFSCDDKANAAFTTKWASRIEERKVVDGVLHGTALKHPAYFGIIEVNQPLEEVSLAIVEMMAEPGAGKLQIWANINEPSKSYQEIPLITDGEFHTYVVDFEKMPLVKAARVIKNIRLNPMTATTPHHFALKSFRLIPRHKHIQGVSAAIPKAPKTLVVPSFLQQPNGGEAAVATRLEMNYTDEALVIKYETGLNNVSYQANGLKDGRVWADDCLDMTFLFERERYYQVVCNPNGTLLDQRVTYAKYLSPEVKANSSLGHAEPEWESEAKVVTDIRPGCWSGSVTLYWKSFGLSAPPKEFKMNIARRSVADSKGYSGWNHSPFHSLSSYENLRSIVLGEEPSAVVELEYGAKPLPGRNQATFRNPNRRVLECVVTVRDLKTGRNLVFRKEGTGERIAVDYELGESDYEIMLTASENGNMRFFDVATAETQAFRKKLDHLCGVVSGWAADGPFAEARERLVSRGKALQSQNPPDFTAIRGYIVEVERINRDLQLQSLYQATLRNFGRKTLPFAVATASSADKIFHSLDAEVPAFKGRAASALAIEAAANEVEGTQLVLVEIGQPTSGIKIKLTRTPSGIAPKIRLYGIEFHDTTKTIETSYKVEYRGEWPDVLSNDLPKSLAPQEVRSIWVNAEVAGDVPAGEYAYALELSADGMEPLTIPLTVKVWDFALPVVPSLRTGLSTYNRFIHRYYEKFRSEEFSDAEKAEITDTLVRFLLRHRMNPGYIYTMMAYSGEVIDYPDLNRLAEYRKLGLNAIPVGQLPPHAYRGTAEQMIEAYYKEPKVENFLKTMKATYEMASKQGLGDALYIHAFDEIFAHAHAKEKIAKLVELRARLREVVPKIKVECISDVLPELVGVVDIWDPSIKMMTRNPEQYWERQKAGDELWMYTCLGAPGQVPGEPPSFVLEESAAAMRLIGWICYFYKAEGFTYYALNHWQRNGAKGEPPYPETPWNIQHVNTFNGEAHLIFPAHRHDLEPLSSIRLENLRDGFEDYEYLKLLSDLYHAGKEQLNADDRREIDSLLSMRELVRSGVDYTDDSEKIAASRRRIAFWIERLKQK